MISKDALKAVGFSPIGPEHFHEDREYGDIYLVTDGVCFDYAQPQGFRWDRSGRRWASTKYTVERTVFSGHKTNNDVQYQQRLHFEPSWAKFVQAAPKLYTVDPWC